MLILFMYMESTKTSESHSPVYETLGKRAYMVILTKSTNPAFSTFLIAIVLLILDKQKFIATSQMHQTGIIHWVIICLLILGVILLFVGFVIAKVKYASYTFSVGEDALKVRTGIFNKREIAIPYRQIQDIEITRSFLEQFMGVSRVEILTAGEDETNKGKDSEAVLSMIDHERAVTLQAELIHRANIQKVVQDKP